MTPLNSNAHSVSQFQKVLFIDSRVPDLSAIVAAARPGVNIVVLHEHSSGLAQMVQALEGEQGLLSISVVSHGDAGLLLLGNGPLFAGDLPQHQAELQAIGAALAPGGDLLLYGCDVGAGPTSPRPPTARALPLWEAIGCWNPTPALLTLRPSSVALARRGLKAFCQLTTRPRLRQPRWAPARWSLTSAARPLT